MLYRQESFFILFNGGFAADDAQIALLKHRLHDIRQSAYIFFIRIQDLISFFLHLFPCHARIVSVEGEHPFPWG